ncbi:unnamed protein product [Lymnaea stagnalis]|uniref:Uncharacterized protein n=1 Tax=Lymnaea stagnalis TaxID=6523 RepID=A0AAV2HT80_LYMST
MESLAEKMEETGENADDPSLNNGKRKEDGQRKKDGQRKEVSYGNEDGQRKENGQSKDGDNRNEDGQRKEGKNLKDGVSQKNQGVPVDRGWAWVIAFGTFLNMAIIVGHNRALSVLFVDIVQEFQESNTVITLMFTVHALSGSISSVLIANLAMKRFSVRIITVVSALVNGIMSIFICLAPNIIVFLFLFLIKGITFGGLMVCPMSMIGFYFKKRRALASSIGNAGFCIAYIAFPPITELLRQEFGFRGALLLIAGVEFQLVAFNMLFRPVDSYKKIYANKMKRRVAEEKTLPPIYKGPVHEITTDSSPLLGQLTPGDPERQLNGDVGENMELVPVERTGTRTTDRTDAETAERTGAHATDRTETQTTERTETQTTDRTETQTTDRTETQTTDRTETQTTDRTETQTTDRTETQTTDRNDRQSIGRAQEHSERDIHDNDIEQEISRTDLNKKENTIDEVDFRQRSSSEDLESDNEENDTVAVLPFSSLRNVFVASRQASEDEAVSDSKRLSNKQLYTSQLSVISQADLPCILPAQIEDDEIKVKETWRSQFNKIIDLSLFKLWTFRMMALFITFGVFGNYISIYMPTIAFKFGISKPDAAQLMMVSGIMDLVTRILTGVIADFKLVSKIKMVLVSKLIICAICQCARFFHTYTLFVVFAVLVGIFGGFRQNFTNVILLDYFGPENMAKANGLLMTIATLTLSINHPVLGALLDATGSFVVPLHYIGTMCFLSGLVLFAEPIFKKLDDKKKTNLKQEKKSGQDGVEAGLLQDKSIEKIETK